MQLRHFSIFLFVLIFSVSAFGQSKSNPSNKFEQLEKELPTANEYRTASGAPGNKYWQQRADYSIDVEIDDVNQRIIGKETVTYKNLSPDSLNYVWLQIDQNIFSKRFGRATDANRSCVRCGRRAAFDGRRPCGQAL